MIVEATIYMSICNSWARQLYSMSMVDIQKMLIKRWSKGYLALWPRNY